MPPTSRTDQIKKESGPRQTVIRPQAPPAKQPRIRCRPRKCVQAPSRSKTTRHEITIWLRAGRLSHDQRTTVSIAATPPIIAKRRALARSIVVAVVPAVILTAAVSVLGDEPLP